MRLFVPIAVLSALLLTGCEPMNPDMDHALVLYQGGAINEARLEMGEYIVHRPYSSDLASASQHIVLIRRIKRLEATVIEHWRTGNEASARRSLGVIRFLHPVYADSAKVFSVLNWPSPGDQLGDINYFRSESAGGFIPDSLHVDLAPLMLEVLDRQHELAIHLAERWEANRLALTPWGNLGHARTLIGELSDAYTEFTAASNSTDYYHIGALASEMNLMIASSAMMGGPPTADDELGWIAVKRDLISDILLAKSQLFQTY